MYFFDIDIKNNNMIVADSISGMILEGNVESLLFHVVNMNVTELGGSYIFCGIYRHNNKVLLSNAQDSKLYVLDILQKSIVPQKVDGIQGVKRICFFHDEVFQYENNIYIVLRDGKILKTDCDFNRIVCVLQCPNHNCVEHGQILRSEEILYIPLNNLIYVFSMNKERIVDEFYFNDLDKIETMCCIDNDIWISSTSGVVRRLFDNTNSCLIDFSDDNYNFLQDKIRFSRAYCHENEIWLVPCYCEKIYIFNIEKRLLREFSIDQERENGASLHDKHRSNLQKYIAFAKQNNILWLMSSKTRKFYKINLINGEYDEETFKFVGSEILDDCIANRRALIEGNLSIGLEYLIDAITKGQGI